jgi:hypothetical protein
MSGDELTSASSTQPRDSRVEAFLRQAEGILSAQRQWSAQTQIKLKALAKELKLPPELFETALEIMADPARRTPPTRWEQAFCEYLARQFERLPGDILSLPQERKAMSYGQRKFQLSPDACERCLAQVASQLRIARISDSQAVAYAQTEVARLVSKSTLPAAQLQEQVCQLAERWGVEPKQATRLLLAELSARNAKRRRKWIRSVSLIVGVVGLSGLLIGSIILLGKVLSPAITPSAEKHGQPSETPRELETERQGANGNFLAAPAWWTDRQVDFGARLAKEPGAQTLMMDLTHGDPNQRRDAYARLWRRLADWDQQITLSNDGQSRWLRQPAVQEALLDWFWRDPDLEAVGGWVDGLNRLRALPRSSPDEAQWPAEGPRPAEGQSPAASATVVPQAIATQVLGDLLTATAADTLFLRALPKGNSPSDSAPLDKSANRRVELLTRGHVAPSLLSDPATAELAIEQLRQRWFAENMELAYQRLQGLWRLPFDPEPNGQSDDPRMRTAWLNSVAAVAEIVRLIPDAGRRSRLLVRWWSAVAGIDPALAAAAWPEIEAAIAIVDHDQWEPLLESWYVCPPDSMWGQTLQQRWSDLAMAKQNTVTGSKPDDLIMLQRLLQIPPRPSRFQTRLRQDLVGARIRQLEHPASLAAGETPLAQWRKLSQTVTLAAMIVTATPYSDFDRQVMQAKMDGLDPLRPGWQNAPFLPAEELDQAWEPLLQAQDLEQYKAAVFRIRQLVEKEPLLPLPQAQRIVAYLRQVVSAEEQATWLLALKPTVADPQETIPRGTATNARPGKTTAVVSEEIPILRLLAEPTIAMALADAWEQAPESLPQELAWLGWQVWLAESQDQPLRSSDGEGYPQRLSVWLRRSAWEDLRTWDQSHAITMRSRLAKTYQPALAARLKVNGAGLTGTGSGVTTAADPLVPILLHHDRWAEQVVAPLAVDSATWLADYRAAVADETDTVQALWVAESVVLRLFADYLQTGSPP